MDTNYDRSILIINPNTTQAMTDALKPLVKGLKYRTVCTWELFSQRISRQLSRISIDSLWVLHSAVRCPVD